MPAKLKRISEKVKPGTLIPVRVFLTADMVRRLDRLVESRAELYNTTYRRSDAIRSMIQFGLDEMLVK